MMIGPFLPESITMINIYALNYSTEIHKNINVQK